MISVELDIQLSICLHIIAPFKLQLGSIITVYLFFIKTHEKYTSYNSSFTILKRMKRLDFI